MIRRCDTEEKQKLVPQVGYGPRMSMLSPSAEVASAPRPHHVRGHDKKLKVKEVSDYVEETGDRGLTYGKRCARDHATRAFAIWRGAHACDVQCSYRESVLRLAVCIFVTFSVVRANVFRSFFPRPGSTTYRWTTHLNTVVH